MITSVLSYARARLGVLGYTEHDDAFNFENAPKTKLDSLFHVELGDATGGVHNQSHIELEVPFTVRVWKAPKRKTNTTRDEAIAAADSVVADLLKASNRTLQSGGLKNVRFERVGFNPLDESNDNGIITKLDFVAVVWISTA